MNLGDGNRGVPETAATQNLRVHFNWSEADFAALAVTGRALRGEGGNLWRFPEATLVRYAREGTLRMPLPKAGDDIAINKSFLRQLIDHLPVGNDNDKKKSLEFLASYLAVTLPGVRIKTNVKAFEHGAVFEHEIDLVVIQYGAVPTYLMEALGRHFLIECTAIP